MSHWDNGSIRLNEILEHSPDGMFIIDTELRIRYVNPAFCKLIEYTEEELLGTPITHYLGDLKILDSCMRSVQAQGHCNDQETTFKRKNGTQVHISKNVQALYTKEEEMRAILVSVRDLSALHYLNKQLLESKTDALTRLPNRLKLLSDLNALKNPFTLLLLNIDRFREINTFYGHAIGDQLLIEMGNVLLEYAQTMSNSTVYKLPGDEYAIIVQKACDDDQISHCASRLLDELNPKKLNVSGQEINLNLTLGIARTTGQEAYRNEILHQADMALELAKKMQKNFLFFDESLHIKEDYENNLRWIKRLRNAIDENRVVPYYQPIVNAKTHQVEKFESLVRIVENDGTVISPMAFLGISKKVKLYERIMKIMITKVLETLPGYPEHTFSINLSIEDINNPEMSAYIIQAIKNSPYSNRIIFEILESEGIDNYDTVRDFIRQVKQYGVNIAIDDFGAGYSNFVYITQLDIDYIKIDGSIIRNIHQNKTSQVIAHTIIDFASQLNIKTIAEFVASKEVFDYVNLLPFDGLQGYYFAEPAATPLTTLIR